MDWDTIDWDALARLRGRFLDGGAGAVDYWLRPGDLESYHQTFAQRIGWKWADVLAHLERRGWTPPVGTVLDWGCGSGIAGQTFIRHFGDSAPTGLVLWDRSALAMDYAADAARRAFPRLSVERAASGTAACTTLLVSHVITELAPTQVDALVALAARATAVLWVEPGSHPAGRALMEVRERLRGEFHVVAPCTHREACGMLAPGAERHWCHHFAPSPPEAFTDRNWARFARVAGVDLRSLPVSFLVLDKRPPAPLPAGTVRVIGRPRVGKAHALLCGCDSGGVRERRLAKRGHAAEFRRLKHGDFDPLQVWQCDGDEILALRPALPPEPDPRERDS